MNVYDFDNTIFNGDSLIRFYFYSLRKKLSLIRFIFVQIWYVFLRLIHAVSLDRAKEKCFCFYFSLSAEERQTLLDGFWKKNRKNIKGWYLEQRKDTDIVISATPKVIIEPIARELGFKLIATEIDEENKKFLTKNCKGEEKVKRLREVTSEPIDEFYTDSLSDKYLAREAKCAYLVSGNYVIKWESDNLSEKPPTKTSAKAKSVLKKVGISLGILLLSCTILFSLLIAAYALPTSAMQAHRKESLDTIERQGQYFMLIGTQIDNYTDRDFIDVATFDSNESLLERAFRNPGEETSYYIRYVSGFAVVLKPLMLIMNITGVRILNAVLHVIIIGILIFLFLKKKLVWSMVAFLVAYLFMSPVSMAYTLAFNPDFYITTLILILMLVLDKWLTKHRFYPYFFILAGIFISFFDLLMFTLVAFGLPLVMYFNLHPPKTFPEGLKTIILFGICWVFGYLGTILLKEIIASLVTGENVLKLFKDVIINRSSADVWGDSYGRMEGIIRNVRTSMKPTHIIAVNIGLFCVGFRMLVSQKQGSKKYIYIGISLFMFAATFLVIFLTLGAQISKWYSFAMLLVYFFYTCFVIAKFAPVDKKLFSRLFWTFLIIALIPFVWYFVFLNHSIIHFWYSFRLIAISIFACFSALFIYLGKIESQSKYYRHSQLKLN